MAKMVDTLRAVENNTPVLEPLQIWSARIGLGGKPLRTVRILAKYPVPNKYNYG